MTVIVIPAHNEETTIAEVVSKAQNHGHVLVVCDGCEDETLNEARRAGAQVLELCGKHGAGFATTRGIEEALRWGADIVVTMDADGQHSAGWIPDLLSLLCNDYDFSVGLRGIGWRRGRIIASWIFNFLTGASWWHDSQSGFKAMTRATAEIMVKHVKSPHFAFCSEMLMVAWKNGVRVGWVPVPEINTEYSLKKPHRQRWFHVPRLAWQILRVRVRPSSAALPESPTEK